MPRVRLAAAAVERQHQLPPQALAEGALLQRGADCGLDLRVLSQRERRFEPLLQRVEPQCLQPAASARAHAESGRPSNGGPAREPARLRSFPWPSEGHPRRARCAQRRRAPRTGMHPLPPLPAHSRSVRAGSPRARARVAAASRGVAPRCGAPPAGRCPTTRRPTNPWRPPDRRSARSTTSACRAPNIHRLPATITSNRPRRRTSRVAHNCNLRGLVSLSHEQFLTSSVVLRLYEDRGELPPLANERGRALLRNAALT